MTDLYAHSHVLAEQLADVEPVDLDELAERIEALPEPALRVIAAVLDALEHGASLETAYAVAAATAARHLEFE